jgi:hypothetical protein
VRMRLALRWMGRSRHCERSNPCFEDGEVVARMERQRNAGRVVPDFASRQPGYVL